MYQVITIYGENEPWWFFDDWQEAITSKTEYASFEEAEVDFLDKYQKRMEINEKIKCKDPYLVAFWNEDDTIYCEDCDEDLQAYEGLMLLHNFKKLDDGDNKDNETTHYSGKAKCCQRLSQGTRGYTS
ncbi:DUF1033 family protein [Vagococcus sp.]|uniref:DUF1033 family protein n=1 Tax=Vagococcus sp. TaxID=1933889 RepID=UPI003F9C61ED